MTEPGTDYSPVTEPGTGSGTGFHWWFRYRCEIKFRSGPISFILGQHVSGGTTAVDLTKLMIQECGQLHQFLLICLSLKLNNSGPAFVFK